MFSGSRWCASGGRPQPSGLSLKPKKTLAESPVSSVNAGSLLTGGLRLAARVRTFRNLAEYRLTGARIRPSVPLPEGMAWSELAIEVGDTALAITAGAITRELTFEKSGFADMRQGDMAGDRALQTLRLFAVKHGRFAPRKVAGAAEEKTPFKKQVSVLRQRLKSLFPIEGEPIIFEKTSGEYRCAFNVSLESDGGYPTPDGATWRDFRFEEMAGGRLRVGVVTRETYHAKTRPRGSDRPSSEAAEREARLWREYPLERLGLTNGHGMPSPEGLALLSFLRGGGVLERLGGDMGVLHLARRLREWTGLGDEPFRYDESRAGWIANFECAIQRRK
jgi:hypothetical protein